MLRFAVIGVVGALAAGASAQAVLTLGQAHADSTLRPAQAAVDPAVAASAPTSAPASIAKSADGHYWAEAAVNGRAVHLLVDTGATTVALTAEDARRLGYEPKDLDYNYQVTTANGHARAARIELASISVAGAEVQNVEALVIDKGLENFVAGHDLSGPAVTVRRHAVGADPAALRRALPPNDLMPAA